LVRVSRVQTVELGGKKKKKNHKEEAPPYLKGGTPNSEGKEVLVEGKDSAKDWQMSMGENSDLTHHKGATNSSLVT